MNSVSAPGLHTYLMLRVTDVVRLRMQGQTAELIFCGCPPPCFQFAGGSLCGAPRLENVCLTPDRCGCCLRALLCLPVQITIIRDCAGTCLPGEIRLHIEAQLRTACDGGQQFFVQAGLRLYDVMPQGGAACARFDLGLTIYAACPEPVQLPVCAGPPCTPDCPPAFNLPLYPELPNRR